MAAARNRPSVQKAGADSALSAQRSFGLRGIGWACVDVQYRRRVRWSEDGLMEDLMLYPIWRRLPRPRFFPQDPRLDRLLASNYDRGFDGFQLTLRRREARDLRKGIFGPKGSRVVPMLSSKRKEYDGLMEFDQPYGWRLRLTYEPPPSRRRAGRVEAEFMPPRARRSRRHSQEGISLTA